MVPPVRKVQALPFKVWGMNKILFLMGLMLGGHASGAEVAVINGIKMVDVHDWARENSVSYSKSGQGIIIKGSKSSLNLFPYSKNALWNKDAFVLKAPVIVDGDKVWMPLADAWKIFGFGLPDLEDKPKVPAVAQAPVLPAETKVEKFTVSSSTSLAAEGLLAYANVDWGFMNAITPQSAFDACTSAIPVFLKSPATARFVLPLSVISYPNGVWAVRGAVDAQNSYGALVRADITCIVKKNTATHSPMYLDVRTRR